MMEQMDYSALLPTSPPDGLMEWAIKQGALKNEYLIYRVAWYIDPVTEQKTKGVEVVCSACGRRSIQAYVPFEGGCGHYRPPAPFGFIHPITNELVASGSDCLCPECGCGVTAKHICQIPAGILQESWCMSAGRYEDKPVLFGWLLRREISKAGDSHYWAMPYEAYVMEQRKIVRLTAYVKFMSSVSLLGRWEQKKTFRDSWGYAPMFFPVKKNVWQGTVAENCKLPMYCAVAKSDGPQPVTYLRLYQKYPQLENLLVQGAGTLLSEMIEEECKRYCYGAVSSIPKLQDLNLKEKRPAAMLGFNKEELAHCLQMRWSLKELRTYKLVRSLEKVNLPEDMELLRKESAYSIASLATKERGGMSIMRILRYLEKQKVKVGTIADVQYLLDYWRIAEGCAWNMNDPSISLPKDIRIAHDRALREYNERRSQEEIAKRKCEMKSREASFRKRAEALLPFAWECEGLLIRAAKNEAELIREGNILNHCVAGYAQTMAEGKTAIFFIRRAEEPEEPYYTLELDERNLMVRQNRGRKNCDRTAEVQRFEDQWLNHLRAMKAAGELLNKKKSTKTKKESAA